LPSLSGGAGLRFGDVRFNLGARFAPRLRNGQYSDTDAGTVFGNVRAAIANAAFLSGDLYTVPGGWGVQGGARVWFTKSLEAGTGFSYERWVDSTASFPPHRDFTSVYANVGWWLSGAIRLAVQVRHSTTTYRYDGSSSQSSAGTNAFTLSVALRPG
jgi:hypothetical protein